MDVVEEQKQSSGRKRSRAPSPTLKDLSIKEEGLDCIKSLSLEAIFHPKFENENRNDQDIRHQMKKLVVEGKGYLEVSLKHSGSLMLWSGGQRYYSKNSTDNEFTHVGEVLLRQHFFRAWHNHSSKEMEAKYHECSSYVETHRLTLAFEVVTAVLGHHGDVPNHDFLILTAVADRSRERFLSTCELVELAQKFRLPHNDTWVVSSKRGVDSLFHLYDTTRETGLAQDTMEALDKVTGVHVPSMYPHTVFQGNILEGIVIRYVEGHHHLKSLVAESKHILELVPPTSPPAFCLTKNLQDAPPVLTTDIRAVTREAMTTGSRETVTSCLKTSMRKVLCDSSEDERHVESLQGNKEWTKNFPTALKKVLDDVEHADSETRRIWQVIQTLDRLKSGVSYKIVKESFQGNDRWLCIVHVLYDAAHQKFRRKQKHGEMNLFRGFCIELGTSPQNERKSPAQSFANDEDSGLMLKMKFLPYMVRTFACRNGLKEISRNGPSGFRSYTMNLMTKWGISREGMAKWQPFFDAWGRYADAVLKGETNEYTDSSLPKLCDTYYLDHLEHFTTLFEKGAFDNDDVPQSMPQSDFCGVVIVVGLTRERSDSAAKILSERLGGLCMRKGIADIKQVDWAAACLVRERGIVCSAVAGDGLCRIRKKLSDYGEAVFCVLVGCDHNDVDALPAEYLPRLTPKELKSISDKDMVDKRRQKLNGVVTAWRTTRFAQVINVSDEIVVDQSVEEDNSVSDSLDHLVSQLWEASNALQKRDLRPGLLVFFPAIPGSGKSELCSQETERELVRRLGEMVHDGKDVAESAPVRDVIIRSGDENAKKKVKYWNLVSKERGVAPSSVYIADKNAPPPFSWLTVGQACSYPCGVAVPVVPDDSALQTTSIAGARQYPFSLAYLAVCMARVLARPPASHVGKLDSSVDLACMVVVKFYELYGKVSAGLVESVKTSVEKAGAQVSSSPIRVPFFVGGKPPELPSDLTDALSDALRIQYEYEISNDSEVPEDDERVKEAESRLRGLLTKYNDMLMSLTVEPSVSREAFVSQVVEKVAELDASPPPSSRPVETQEFIALVSVDVKAQSVLSLVKSYAESHPRLSKFLEMATEAAVGDDSVLGMNFETDTHVTMAHCSSTKQREMRDTFGGTIGCEVNVTVTGILWTSQIAALAVEVATNIEGVDDVRVPSPKNEFPHITLWRLPEVPAARSNRLPELVTSGKAERVNFSEPTVLKGSISFWSRARCS